MNSAIQQLIVHLDSSDHVAQRLAVARQLAGQHSAALAAMYAVTPGVIAVPYVSLGGETVSAGLLELDEERRARARAAFDEAMKTPGPSATWSALGDYAAAIEFARQALYADLLVLGQPEPGLSSTAGVPADFVESVLMSSGKPAVVIPWIGPQRALGDVVAIAWKQTPEAARAVAAAMPILQRARQVHVLSWASEVPPTVPGRLDLDTWLHAHGIGPQWHHYGEEAMQPGDLILSASCDLGADLLVMGCYGHSRAREWVLGGATRTVLQSMTLPVLMAH